MPKKIDCYLSESSFSSAAQEVHKYIEDVKLKCEQFGYMLSLHGFQVSSIIVNSIPSTEAKSINVHIDETAIDGVYEGKIILDGDECVFVEFGSGIYYNPTSSGSFHPQGQQLGFTIDSYNPNGKANIPGWNGSNATNPKGWFTPDGEHSYGTHTYMPLELGLEEMLKDVTSIARSVFA